ncbi:hypothetical protein Ancab_024047 [Ancistrocladus abbreviatus]
MSQQQPWRRSAEEEPIKYGDIFATVQGNLAEQPVAPRDASMMQKAENMVFGKTAKGGEAAAMQLAAMQNEKAGFVGHSDATDSAPKGVGITEGDLADRTLIVETVGDQVVNLGEPSKRGGRRSPQAMQKKKNMNLSINQHPITIGEALEATAITAGQKPVDHSDAAAIQAAEVRATGRTSIMAGGLAAAAQSAAQHNSRVKRDEDKTKLADILTDASSKLPNDKPATRQDAEGVVGAELRNSPNLVTHPTGVAASVVAAARLNQSSYNSANY